MHACWVARRCAAALPGGRHADGGRSADGRGDRGARPRRPHHLRRRCEPARARAWSALLLMLNAQRRFRTFFSSFCALTRPGAAATGALIGTATTNATGVATQSFAFTLPGNYTIVSGVSQADGTQYGLANASLAQVLVLDQTTLTLGQVRCRFQGFHPSLQPCARAPPCPRLAFVLGATLLRLHALLCGRACAQRAQSGAMLLHCICYILGKGSSGV